MLFIIGGASGSGKTSCLPGLRHALPEIDWHEFDERGVPAPPIPSDWRITTTESWLRIAIANQKANKDTAIIGGAVYGEVLACPSYPEIDAAAYCLLDCGDPVRIDRIRSRDQGRDSASQEMLNWAAWLRMHASDPTWRPDVIQKRAASAATMHFDRWQNWEKGDSRWRVADIDNSDLSIAETVDELVYWLNGERRRQAVGSLAKARRPKAAIREIRIEDADHFAALTDAVMAESPFMLREPDEPNAWHDRGPEILERIVQNENTTIFVAQIGDHLVGWLSARGGELRRSRGAIYLVIGLREASTGKGIGKNLLEAGEAWARDRDAHRLDLTVLAGNHRARRFYEQAGFRYEGRKPAALKIDGQLADEFMMAKVLR